MNPENPLRWVALLVAVAVVVLPSALALIGIYWHALNTEGDEAAGRNSGKEQA